MTFDLAAERRQLRTLLRGHRRALPPATRMAAAEQLATRLLTLPFAPTQGYVAGYWAMDGEIALHAWQLRLPPGCVYCLPVLGDDDRLRFAPWRSGDALVTNRLGIPEPDLGPDSLLDASQLTLAVMPLVGFDATGQRLGMGGGWYDRTFALRHEQPAPPYLVGAAFDVQRVDALHAAEWDVPVDGVCTESTFFDCRKVPA
ncbi:5-formyltetrahydrofolate cyclo-ligase [Lysobacter olei]